MMFSASPLVLTALQTAGSSGFSLLLLTALITSVVAAIRWTARRTQILVVISGTALLLAFLVVLILAYPFVSGLT
ncbi:hypothetical protein [Nonomuraea wenchangensis]|uniref:Uncharacterized protein n=1 Tax=Nonomuraea wenchangensis TaxID=568860 RepID=A0A1I0LIR6_9ACTN|nr:hypothetical protein [Nonomuraea wenchangensis]SEU39196.1 hypothetical protein SAMN05421811_116171 [Nonomuraea wenchangensis]